MNDVWREWVELAEADLATARREMAVAENPNLRSVCFHAQQAAEKFMKAVLVRRQFVFARTHQLLELDQLLKKMGLNCGCDELDFVALTRGAVALRYPGESVTSDEAQHLLEVAIQIRDKLLRELQPAGE